MKMSSENDLSTLDHASKIHCQQPYRMQFYIARMHEAKDSGDCKIFQSMAHGECKETKVYRPGSHRGMGALPLHTIARANRNSTKAR